MMPNLTPIADWELYLRENVREEIFRKAYLQYANNILAEGCPPIFELEHLSYLTGIDFSYLLRAIHAPHLFYREFIIPKRSGSMRAIASPQPVLLQCQRWILGNILSHIPTDAAAQAYIPGRSIITNAKVHLGANHILKMDIKSFFDSIPLRRVVGIFLRIGYAPTVAFALASLCCLRGSVPQGAATSPTLSNIVAKRLDQRLTGIASKRGLCYTRYSDDLCFSGRYIPVSFIRIVTEIVEAEGFSTNPKKTRLCRQGARRIVTGISISTGTLKIPRATKRRWRMEVHQYLKHGKDKARIPSLSFDPFYLDRLIGRLTFWRTVEPDSVFVQNALPQLQGLARRQPFSGY